MELIQFITLLVVLVGISWRFRAESREDWKTAREDWRRSDEQIKAMNERYHEEMKEIHNKYYDLRERTLKDK